MIVLKLVELWSTSGQDGTAVQVGYYLGFGFQLGWANTQGLAPTLYICVCIPTSDTNRKIVMTTTSFLMKFR